MAGIKPSSAAGYEPEVTVACERALLTLMGAFGSLKKSLRLVGGLVPRYLTPAAPPDVPAHAGTSDVDVVLNLLVLADGEGYASLADQLKNRGFERHVNAKGIPTAWRWKRQVDEHLHVVVEFLQDAGKETPGRPVSIDGERVSALALPYVGIVHDWYQERVVTAELLDGAGTSTETVRFADVPAFIILKAMALDDRHENKDAADLIHVLRYAGTPEEVAKMFVDREQSGLHPGAIQAGLEALRLRFCDDEHGEGYLKLGPISFARFYGDGDEDDDLVREQRFASGLVQALLDSIQSIRESLAAAE